MAIHIDNLHIQSFRGIKNLEISKISDITIFVGDNNTGKTSVLEAIRFFCTPTRFGLMHTARLREIQTFFKRDRLSNVEALKFLFDVNMIKSEKDEYSISISGKAQDSRVSVHVNGFITSQIVDLAEIAQSDSHLRKIISEADLDEQGEMESFLGTIKTLTNDTEFSEEIEITNISKTERRKGEQDTLKSRILRSFDHVHFDPFTKLLKDKIIKEKAVKLIQNFDDTINDIRYVKNNGMSIQVIDSVTSDSYIPLSLYGDGLRKALSLLASIVQAENGVLLIDEFETALHTTAMEKVFKFALESAQAMNVQLFMTTHSIEAVDKLLACAPELLDKIQVVRLRKTEKETFAKIIPGKTALEDRTEYNMELRV